MAEADAVLALHALYVVFVATGFVMIPLGAWRHWRWTQTVSYRLLHTAAIAYVAGEQLFSLPCPLTVWEYRLRGGRGSPRALIPHLLHILLFHRWPGFVFTGLYVSLTALVLLFWWVFPPGPRPGKTQAPTETAARKRRGRL